MFRHSKRHSVPGLNTTSTADISFMLLIFFLVTTSMDTDKGLSRQLPPQDPDQQLKMKDVDKTKVLTIHLMKGDKITVNDKPAQINDALRKDVRHFIIEKGKQHILELQIDRDADYDSYFHLQNQLVRGYKELRDAAAQKKYGKTFGQCSAEEHDAIVDVYPQRIQETVINN